MTGNGKPFIIHFFNKQTAKGGATIVYCPKRKAMSVAVCCEKDTFNRSLGRQIAFSRLEHPEYMNRTGRPRPCRFNHVIQNIEIEPKLESVVTSCQPILTEIANKVGNESLPTLFKQKMAQVKNRTKMSART